MKILRAFIAAIALAFAGVAVADFINDGDYQGVGSSVGGTQDAVDCAVVDEVHDGDVCVPAHADGGDNGGDAGDSGDSGEGAR